MLTSGICVLKDVAMPELAGVVISTCGRVHGRMKLSMRSACVGSMFGGGAFTLLRCLGVSSGTSLQHSTHHI
jgi:hypothetical protein